MELQSDGKKVGRTGLKGQTNPELEVLRRCHSKWFGCNKRLVAINQGCANQHLLFYAVPWYVGHLSQHTRVDFTYAKV